MKNNKANSLQVSKQNSVVIFDNPEDMTTHIRMLQTALLQGEISGTIISCQEWNSLNDMAASCLVKGVLDFLTIRTFDLLAIKSRVNLFNLMNSYKTQKNYQEFALLKQSLAAQKTTEELNRFLARHHESIQEQINKLMDLEQKEFSLIVVSNFQTISNNDQPMLAGILHRLVKGVPAYFRLLTLGRPQLFRKTDFGEVGIQRDHDYVEIVWKSPQN
ncbi:MAG: hypothetical protein DCC55_23490 [Chloroflexi bacterium]|nr:MAG: hypothetical protein DCC55_23490 [Chloroflexota bacterium]